MEKLKTHSVWKLNKFKRIFSTICKVWDGGSGRRNLPEAPGSGRQAPNCFTTRLLPISWLFRETLSYTFRHLHHQNPNPASAGNWSKLLFNSFMVWQIIIKRCIYALRQGHQSKMHPRSQIQLQLAERRGATRLQTSGAASSRLWQKCSNDSFSRGQPGIRSCDGRAVAVCCLHPCPSDLRRAVNTVLTR